jgi:hypothetical protein
MEVRMQRDSVYRGIGFAIVALGLVVALMTAVVPNYAYGHHLNLTLFLLAATPYVVYGAFVPFLRSVVLILPGLILLVIQFYIQIPAWLAVDTPTIAQAFYSSPVMALLITVPIELLLLWWSQRAA